MSDDERQERQEDQALLKVMVGSIIGLAGVVAALAIVAVVVVGQSGASAPRPAASTSAAQVTQPTRTVTVAMHDPGCHWFQIGPNSFGKAETVRGPVVLSNNDEAALLVAGSAGTKTDPVGGKVTLAPGTYRITMVGQAPDDNHLKLVVN